MAFAAVSAGIGAAGLLYGGIKSISQNSKANSIDVANPRPTYQIPDEYKQNVAMANQMARIGIPQQQYNNQINGINQNQAGAIQALSNSANPGAGLASIVRGGNAATGNLNAQDAAQRQANQRFAIGENSQLGAQKLAAQQYNAFDKYSENFNQSQALRGAAAQNLQNGFDAAAQGAAIGAKNYTPAVKPVSNLAQQMQLPASAIASYGLGAPVAKQPYHVPGLFNLWNGTDQNKYYPYPNINQ